MFVIVSARQKKQKNEHNFSVFFFLFLFFYQLCRHMADIGYNVTSRLTKRYKEKKTHVNGSIPHSIEDQQQQQKWVNGDHTYLFDGFYC